MTWGQGNLCLILDGFHFKLSTFICGLYGFEKYFAIRTDSQLYEISDAIDCFFWGGFPSNISFIEVGGAVNFLET